MPRIAYVNGRYLPHGAASVHIEDRGYQFADGIYEVIHVRQSRLIDADLHFERFDYSLRELRITAPMARGGLRLVLGELIARNGLGNGIVYFQATRGVAPRDHKFPARSRTSLVATVKPLKPVAPGLLEKGVTVVSIPDIRWQRCDIKSLSLLPNVLGKQYAVEQGAYEAWQIDRDGFVTEGTSTNAWIVNEDGCLITRPLSHDILGGTVRRALVGLLDGLALPFEERPFSLAEAKTAREAFLTSSSGFLLPVTRLDGASIGDGKVGPIVRELRRRFDGHVARQTA
ncbi:MAG: D-alanine transaminase [Rhodospirillaceae bacterium]|jgi:D-alanine transaminase|nr:D-alanine transaminase [Rhodospirillaceae bacterium]